MSRASRARDALDAGEAALLADFDSYLAGDTVTAAAGPSASASSSSATGSPAPAAGPTATPFSLLSEIFPHLPARTIRAALTSAGGDAESAAAALAAQDAERVASDAEIAELLQQAELQRVRGGAGSGAGGPPVPVRRRPPRGDLVSVRTPPRVDVTTPPRIVPAGGAGRGGAGSPAGGSIHVSAYGPGTITNPRRPEASHMLTPQARKEVLDALREVIVPSLRAHFDEIAFGDYAVDEPSYSFSLEQVAVSGLSLTTESIMVRAVSGGFRVSVVNLFIELDIGRWQYHSRTLFGMKDGGAARVAINGLAAAAMLVPRSKTAGHISVDVGEVEVTIDGPCRLRAQGSTADWAYNAAAVILKPLVVAYVKDAVRDVLTSALAIQLSGWTAWSVDNLQTPPATPEPPAAAIDLDDDAPLPRSPATPGATPTAGNTDSATPN
jgi:hypothetical protein